MAGFKVQIEDVDQASGDGGWLTVAEGTTVGYKRILPCKPTTARRLRVVVTGTKARPEINGFSLFSR